MSLNRKKEGDLMVAKLVTVSLTTRIIVPHDASENIIQLEAYNGLLSQLECSFGENIEKIEDDAECPYGTFENDKK